MPRPLLILVFTALLGFGGRFAFAQPPRGPLVISPQVNANKTVTFRYLAPSAQEVLLNGGQFGSSTVPMTKDEQGIWSVTVGPVKPDIYPYSFGVDGVTVMDPANVAFFPNERFKASLVDVPGDTPLVHALKDVPHGTVTYEYYSSISGTTGSLVVYTPPGYDQNASKKYPVFYLISGTTDTEETYFKVGKTNFILDNLLAEGKAKPMIIVMPYGNVAARVAEQTGKPKPADPIVRDDAEAVSRAKAFETDLLTNVIPYVEKNYRTLNNRENRAIGGFSRGGGQTLRAAFGNMDKFAWVCSYSSYLSPQEMDRSFPQIGANAAYTNKQFKLLWVSVGTEDFLYKGTVASAVYTLTSRYEAGIDQFPSKPWRPNGYHSEEVAKYDDLLGKQVYAPTTVRGRITRGTSEFTVAIAPQNKGVLLRRTLDYSYPNQTAEVFVADEAAARNGQWNRVGIWYLAGSNTCLYSNPGGELALRELNVQTSNRQLRDDEFLLPAGLTQGINKLRVRVKFVPNKQELHPGTAFPNQSAWSELSYQVYCYVPTSTL